MNLDIGVALRDVVAGGSIGRSTCVLVFLTMMLKNDPDTERIFDEMFNRLPKADQRPVIEALNMIIWENPVKVPKQALPGDRARKA